MAKRFRYRLSFSMYDDTFIDSEIVDYLFSHDAGHARQEAIRSLLRAGFSSLVKNNDKRQASIDSLDPSVLAAALQILNNVNQAGNIAQQPTHAYQPIDQNQGFVQEPTQEPSQRKHEKGQVNKVENSNQASEEDLSQRKNNIDDLSDENLEKEKEFTSSINIDKSKHIEPQIHESTLEESDNQDNERNKDLSLDIDDDDIVDPMSMFGEGGML